MNIPEGRKRKIIEVGNSSAVTLPKPWLKYNNLEIGDSVELISNHNTIVIRKEEGKK